MISENLLPNRDFSWFDVVEPREEDFDTLTNKIHIPFLLVQDTLKPEHLPKYEQVEDNHFLMMRSYDSDCDKNCTTVQELTRKIAIYITEKKLVTIHRVELDHISKLKEKCARHEIPKTLQGLVHQIVLGIIRTYDEPLRNLQDLYDNFEEDVLSKNEEKLDTKNIYKFRRQLFLIKRLLKQTNDALYRSKEFWDEYPGMLQDLKENIDQVYFQLDEISDNFEHLFQLHIALNDQRANDVMKVLTVFSSILLPLNFVASFYGMNFEFLPGLHSVHAFGTIVLIMVLITVAAIWIFKKKGWLTRAGE